MKEQHSIASVESCPSWSTEVLTQPGLSCLCSWKSCSIINKVCTDSTKSQRGSCWPLVISYSADLSLAAQQSTAGTSAEIQSPCWKDRLPGCFICSLGRDAGLAPRALCCAQSELPSCSWHCQLLFPAENVWSLFIVHSCSWLPPPPLTTSAGKEDFPIKVKRRDWYSCSRSKSI